MNDLISKSRLKNELLKIPSEMGLIEKAWVIQAVNKQKIQDSDNNCNCQHNSNSRDNGPCCRCDSKQTYADRIRKMSDEELADWLHNMCDFEKDEEPYKSIYNLDTEQEEEIHDSYGDLLKWLQSEVKVEESEEK